MYTSDLKTQEYQQKYISISIKNYAESIPKYAEYWVGDVQRRQQWLLTVYVSFHKTYTAIVAAFKYYQLNI